MFRLTALLASVLSVAAFAPARMASKASGLQMSFKEAIGAQPPLGFWDPLVPSPLPTCHLSLQAVLNFFAVGNP